MQSAGTRERVKNSTIGLTVRAKRGERFAMGMVDIREHDRSPSHLRMTFAINGIIVQRTGRVPQSPREARNRDGEAVTLDYWTTGTFPIPDRADVELVLWSENKKPCKTRAQIVLSDTEIPEDRQV